jgi:hypothetical protein
MSSNHIFDLPSLNFAASFICAGQLLHGSMGYMDMFHCIFFICRKSLLLGCEAVHTVYSLHKGDRPYAIGLC